MTNRRKVAMSRCSAKFVVQAKGSGMALHPGQHLVHLAHLPAPVRGAPVGEERVGLVEDEEGPGSRAPRRTRPRSAARSHRPTARADRTRASASPRAPGVPRGSGANALLPVPGGPWRESEKPRPAPPTRLSARVTGSALSWMSPRSNLGGGACGGFPHPSTRERLRTPWRTASMPPLASPAAAVAPAPTPGVASNSRASESASSLPASMP